jgi:hypothetical protein
MSYLSLTCYVLCAPAASFYLTAAQWVQFTECLQPPVNSTHSPYNRSSSSLSLSSQSSSPSSSTQRLGRGHRNSLVIFFQRQLTVRIAFSRQPRLRDGRSGVRVPAGSRDFCLFLPIVQTCLGTHHAPHSVVTCGVFGRWKAAGGWENKNECSHFCIPAVCLRNMESAAVIFTFLRTQSLRNLCGPNTFLLLTGSHCIVRGTFRGSVLNR